MATAITLQSAKHVAKWKVGEEAKNPARGTLERMALSMKGAQSVEEIFSMLDDLGFCLAFKDKTHPFIKSALENGSIIVDD